MTNQILLPPMRRVRAGDWSGDQLPAGSSKAQIISDEQGVAWVVKSINAPQGVLPGIKSSFNDYLAGRMIELIGLPVAQTAIMEVDSDFLDNYYPQLKDASRGGFRPGLHFACRFHQGSFTLSDFNTLGMLSHLQSRCTNRSIVNDMVAVDSCGANWDRSNMFSGVFTQNLGNILFRQTASGLETCFIDHGYFFAADWNTANPPVGPTTIGYWPEELFGIYHALTKLGWYDETAIQNGLLNMHRISLRALQEIVDEIPTSWKVFTTPTNIDAMLVYLIQRIAAYHRVIASHFHPSHARALAG